MRISLGRARISMAKEATNDCKAQTANRRGGEDIVAALLSSGADPNSIGLDRRTPLHIAAWRAENPQNIALLIMSGAKVGSDDSDNRTPLHLAAEGSNSVLAISTLVNFGASVDEKNDDDQTPLQIAAAFARSSEIFSILLENSEDRCASDVDGRTALSNAESNPNIKGSEPYWDLHQECIEND